MPRDTVTKWVVAFTLLLIVASALLFLLTIRDKAYVRLGDQTITAKIADSPEELAKGLSGTKELPENNGLLLIFDHSNHWPIWMKDMHYPIDIIWIDEGYKVVDFKKHVSPDSYPTEFKPNKPAKYVVEVPAGYIDKHTIGMYTLVSIQTWRW